MRTHWLLIVFSIPCFASPNSGVDWPGFRGPNGSGVTAAVGLPVEMGPEKNLTWKTAVPSGHSSPALTEGRIFMTAAEDGKLLTLCLDRATGRILWRREAPRSRNTKIRAKNTAASPSPATDGDNVYVFFEDFGLLAYGSDGNERWRYAIEPLNTPYGPGASPVLAGDLALLLSDQDTNSYLLAVDRKSGRLRWKTPRPEATHGFATPVIYRPAKGPAQIIVSGAYQIDAYDLASGERIWWVRGMAWQAKSTPVLAGDVLYVHSWMASPSELGLQGSVPEFKKALEDWDANKDGTLASVEVPDVEMRKLWFLFDLDKDGVLNEREWNVHRARAAAKNGLFAIRLGGRGDLTGTAVMWRYEKGLPNIPSPVLYKNILYMLKEGGILTALNPATGEVLKQGRLQGALEPYFASPVAADGKIFTVSLNGKLAALKAGADWEVLSVSDLGEECWATPAIADGHLYVRTVNAVYCFGKKG